MLRLWARSLVVSSLCLLRADEATRRDLAVRRDTVTPFWWGLRTLLKVGWLLLAFCMRLYVLCWLVRQESVAPFWWGPACRPQGC